MKVCTITFFVLLLCCSLITSATVSSAVKSVASLDLDEIEAESMDNFVQKETKNRVKSLAFAKNSNSAEMKGKLSTTSSEKSSINEIKESTAPTTSLISKSAQVETTEAEDTSSNDDSPATWMNLGLANLLALALIFF